MHIRKRRPKDDAEPGRIVINGAFRGQRITGQQRYATEVARELLAKPGVSEIVPPPAIQKNRVLSWFWALTCHLRISRDDTLLTLTSRGPLWSRRQALVVHDLFVLDHPEWYSRKYRITHAPVLRSQIKSAKQLFAVSAPVATEVQHRFSLKNTPVTAPNAPSAIFTQDVPDTGILDRFNLAPQRFFLTVGSLDPRKNLDRLVTAYLQLPSDVRRDYPLVIAGGSSDVFRSENNAPAEESGVVRLGYVSDEELAQLYSNAHVFVFPALDEGFGLPIVEAMAAGSRVYASDIKVFHWVGGDAVEYFNPYDLENITDVLLASGTTEPVRGIEPPGVRFSWEKTADAIYSTLVSAR